MFIGKTVSDVNILVLLTNSSLIGLTEIFDVNSMSGTTSVAIPCIVLIRLTERYGVILHADEFVK